MFARQSTRPCGLPSRNIGVAVGPTATALTVMSRPRSAFSRIKVVAIAPLVVFPASDAAHKVSGTVLRDRVDSAHVTS